MALDDLVEALARERPAAEVDEQAGHRSCPDEVRTAGAQVALDRGSRLAAKGDDALLVALSVGSHERAPEVDVVDVQANHLGGPEAAAVHHLEQRPVAKL